MAHAAAREHFGGSLRMSLAADLHVGLIRGPGCVRLFHLHTSTPGLTVHLPVTGIVPGGEPLLTVINDPDDGVEDIAVGPDITLAPGEMVHCYRTSSGWLYDQRAVEVGTGLVIGRIPFHFDLRGSNTYWRASLRLAERGWDGVTPVALSITIHENSIVGSHSTGAAALNSDTLPSGSTMLLRIKDTGYISGKGGRGGRGGDAGTGLLAQAGSPGGIGLRTTVPTVVINEGTIQGGGGGGGGGASSGSVGGAGGGGGAGYQASLGGQGGSPSGLAGYSGATNIGGPARGSSGAGGDPGSAGAAGSASGGAGGAAISGYSLCTFVRTGTILGSTTG